MDKFICSFLVAIFKVGFRTVAMCGGLVMFSRTELYVVPLLHIATQSIWWPGENWVRSKNHKVLDLQVRNLLLASFVIRIFTVHSVQIANFRKFSFHVHNRYNFAILFEFSNFDVLTQARVRLATNTLLQTPHRAGALCTGYALYEQTLCEIGLQR